MHEGDPGVHLHAGRELPPGDRPRHRQRALGGVDHGTQAQGLLDDRVQVVVAVVGSDLVAQAVDGRRVAKQQLECEGEPRCRGLMAGAEHGDQLVT